MSFPQTVSGLSFRDKMRSLVTQEGLRVEQLLLYIKKDPVEAFVHLNWHNKLCIMHYMIHNNVYRSNANCFLLLLCQLSSNLRQLACGSIFSIQSGIFSPFEKMKKVSIYLQFKEKITPNESSQIIKRDVFLSFPKRMNSFLCKVTCTLLYFCVLGNPSIHLAVGFYCVY